MANYHAKGTVGNKSRTGLPKPSGSGTPCPDGAMTSFTLRVHSDELTDWKHLAKLMQMPLGMMVRAAMRDYSEELEL